MRTLSFIRTLGAGSFGTVYLAEFSSGAGFRRQVAVKVIQGNQPDSEMFLARIRDEARLLGLLQDDAILKVLDMIQIDGMDAVVMEYVEGVDLDTLVREGEPPAPRALAELAASVAGALSRAHTAVHPANRQPLNVVHRDVKPANIMVTSSGGVKLLDFGVARARFDARESQTGQFMLGTLNYMAPEYIVTGEVSPAADVYGLALAVWETAAGEGFGQPKIRQDAHERRVNERLEKIRASHGELIPLLEKMLQWNPAERPTAASVERSFLVAADNLRGTGLRTWASTQVAKVIRSRTMAPDSASLIGKTIPLNPGMGGDAPLGALVPTPTLVPEQPLPVQPRTNLAARAPATLTPARTPANPTAPTAPPPPRTNTSAPPPPPPLTPPAVPRNVPPAPPVASPRTPPAKTNPPAPATPSSPSRPPATPNRTPVPAAPRPRPPASNMDMIIKGLLLGAVVGLLGVAAIAVLLYFLRPTA